MPAGRPKTAPPPGELYSFAHLFYWEFRRLIEGSHRFRMDEQRFAKLRSEAEKKPVVLDVDQIASINRGIEREVRSGQLRPEPRHLIARRNDIAEGLAFVTRDSMLEDAADEARMALRIPGEPEVFEEMLRAKTPETIRDICKQATSLEERRFPDGIKRKILVNNWPISSGSVLPTNLSQYAEQFIAAKSDPKFPKSATRPTTTLKQIWFLSRALAGALFGIRTRTAINLVGSLRPEQAFDQIGNARPRRCKTRKHRR
jgi:hypothetical protein